MNPRKASAVPLPALAAFLGLGLLVPALFQAAFYSGPSLGAAFAFAASLALLPLLLNPPALASGQGPRLGALALGLLALFSGQGLLWHQRFHPACLDPGLALLACGAGALAWAVREGAPSAGARGDSAAAPGFGREMLWFLPALALALFFRWWRLGSVPRGYWFDEAAYGQAILSRVLAVRAAPLYLNGLVEHPGMFFWLGAVFFRLFGESFLSLRVMAAVFSSLALFPFYFLARQWFGPRLAALGLLLYGCARWGFMLGRIGFMNSLATFWMLLTLAFFWRALQGRRRLDWALAGLCLGASVYCYIPIRLLPPLLAVFFLLSWRSLMPRTGWARLGLFGLGFLLAAGPLLLFAATHFAEFSERLGQVSILNDYHTQGARVFWISFRRHLGMFQVQGDYNGRHNLSFYPQLDCLTGALFAPGLLLAHLRFGRDPRARLSVLWFWVMLSAGIFSILVEAPQANRTSLIVPVIPLAILLFLERARDFLGRALPGLPARALAPALLVGLLASPAFNYHEYFQLWPRDPATWRSFSPHASAAARRLEKAGPGWDLMLSSLPHQYPFDGFEMEEICSFAVSRQGQIVDGLRASNPVSPRDPLGALCLWGRSDKEITAAAERQFPDLPLESPQDPYDSKPQYLAMQVPLDRIPLLKAPPQGPLAPFLYRLRP